MSDLDKSTARTPHSVIKACLLSEAAHYLGEVRAVHSIRKNPYSSTHSGFLVDLECEALGRTLVLAKLRDQSLQAAYSSFDKLTYEGLIYRDLLSTVEHVSWPFLCSVSCDHFTLLLFRWIKDATTLNKTSYPTGIFRAARWLGSYQDSVSSLICSQNPHYLKQYDQAWLESELLSIYSTYDINSSLGTNDTSFIKRILLRLERSTASISAALSNTKTLVHGDFYPQNILITTSEIIPIDWERAGSGSELLDLAALLDRWPPDTTRRCISIYMKYRGISAYCHREYIAARVAMLIQAFSSRCASKSSPAKGEKYVFHLGLFLARLEEALFQYDSLFS